MMTKTEFFEYVKENLKSCLPESYQEATVELISVKKNNDVTLCGMLVKTQERKIVPTIYLDAFYEGYRDGQMTKEQVLEAAAKLQVEYVQTDLGFDIGDIFSYEKIKDKLQIVICDPDRNEERLKQLVHTRVGDFAAIYYVNLYMGEDGTKRAAVTPGMFSRWGVTLKQLHADALAADLLREPVLNDLGGMIGYFQFGKKPENLLKQEKKEEKEDPMQLPAVEAQGPALFPVLPEPDVAMYCFTN